VRIIGGKYGGRKLHPPRNLPVRPTTDYAKEALFNILNNLVDFEALRVLDLFAGTGSISIEFLSRGASEVVAVDQDFKCIEFIRKTKEVLGDDRLKPVRANIFSFLERSVSTFDLVFADPPYDLARIGEFPGLVLKNQLLTEEGWFVLEHSGKFSFESHPFFRQHRVYGNVNFTFFQYSSS
jgi:16S rRNA (guanine966-N2)-methyltransferase